MNPYLPWLFRILIRNNFIVGLLYRRFKYVPCVVRVVVSRLIFFDGKTRRLPVLLSQRT